MKRITRHIVFLTALAAAALLAGAAAGQDGQTAPPQAPDAGGDSTSPSQEARDRINTIRANEFFYQSYGKTDPFRTLIRGDFEHVEGKEIVDISSANLVGVMWGEEDRFGLVEDGDGFGYILRVGDRVMNGRVVSIRKTSLTARITLYGITSSVVLKLEKTED
jgi:hypothetical protein